MRTVAGFNHKWLFSPGQLGDHEPDNLFELVTLPHTNRLVPHHNFDESEYAFLSTYRKRFTLPEERQGRRVFVDFAGAMIACSAYLNGVKVGEHAGGYTPFAFELTRNLREDKENLLTIYLDSTERPDIPPYGHVVDYMTFGGIYRQVELRMVEPLHITNVFAKCNEPLKNPCKLTMLVSLSDAQTIGINDSSQYRVSISEASTDAQIATTEWMTASTGNSARAPLQCAFEIPNPRRWTLESPFLYQYRVELRHAHGNISSLVDQVQGSFGIRDAEFRSDGFYLNDQKIDLIGLNRHQTYPYIGASAPRRLQQRDAEIIKFDLGCNIVRTAHYPQSPDFLRRCDEIGLLVFEEIPGWQHVGDSDWKALSLRDLEAMILRDRNHPSIVLWGVRINESKDHDAFYKATNDIARTLDPTRQTGGVRDFLESNFLEDVFTFNDFSNRVSEPSHQPHLITEFNGHM